MQQLPPRCAACWFMQAAMPLDARKVDPRTAALRRLVVTKLCLGASRGSCPLG